MMVMAKRQKRLEKMEAGVELGARILGHRLVIDPAISDAEYWHMRQRLNGPHVGKVVAQVNLVELIGGLARIDGRSVLQEEAAARYRRAWDGAQIGGARALDYTQARVDTSGAGATNMLEFGEWARADYSAAARYLGMMRSSLVERVVVHDQSIRSIAGTGRRAQVRLRDELLGILDDLAVHFQLAPRARS